MGLHASVTLRSWRWRWGSEWLGELSFVTWASWTFSEGGEQGGSCEDAKIGVDHAVRLTMGSSVKSHGHFGGANGGEQVSMRMHKGEQVVFFRLCLIKISLARENFNRPELLPRPGLAKIIEAPAWPF